MILANHLQTLFPGTYSTANKGHTVYITTLQIFRVGPPASNALITPVLVLDVGSVKPTTPTPLQPLPTGVGTLRTGGRVGVAPGGSGIDAGGNSGGVVE